MKSARISLVLILLLMVLASPATGQAADSYNDGVVAEREMYGLPTTPDALHRLAWDDIGSATVGIAATSEELAGLDLPGREEFALAAEESVLRYARELANYAGAYFDPRDDGSLVVLLTEPAPAAVARILELSPPGSRSVSVRTAEFTFEELKRGVERIRLATVAGVDQADLYVVAVDTISNSVIIEANPERIAQIEGARGLLSELSGVPVSVVAGYEPVEMVCTRDNCHSPLRAGILIRKGSTSGGACTMAFHIVKGGNQQWITAGHCGYTGSNNWFHAAIGLVGPELENVYGASGFDGMRVEMPNTQASDLMFEGSSYVPVAVFPEVGQTHTVSLGKQDALDTGVITHAWASWGPSGTTCGCVNWGAKWSGVTFQPGDSGSPIRLGAWPSGLVAIGFSNNTGGITRVGDLLNLFEATIFDD